MRTLGIIAIVALSSLSLAGERAKTALALAGGKPADELTALWPKALGTKPTGLRAYKRTRYSQHLSITNGIDTVTPWHVEQDDALFNITNPNRIFPLGVPGGLKGVAGWSSVTAISIPDGKSVRYWSERVEAGARHPLPRTAWQFPAGTVAADVLLNSETGRVFEVRILERREDGWVSGRPYRSRRDRPSGYHGIVGNACAKCHDLAGMQPGYGIGWVGSDGIFSWSPLREGSNEVDKSKAKHWND